MVHEKGVALVVFEGEDRAEEVRGFVEVHRRVDVVELADFGNGGIISGRQVCGYGTGVIMRMGVVGVIVVMVVGMGMGIVVSLAAGRKEEGIVVDVFAGVGI